MTHEEQRIYLIKELLAEDARYQGIQIPAEEQAQKDLLRSLMNVRLPKPAAVAFLEAQDEYLRAERDTAGVVDGALLPAVPSDPRIVLWQGDITTLKADAIVNAANSSLLGCFHPLHSCIDNIIHTKSGVQLRLFCEGIMRRQGHEEPTGSAKITPAFNLPCSFILHTVGPVIQGRVTKQDCALLASCYRSCLELAAENGCRSVAFCCISTGVFHFPNERAAETAVGAVKDFLDSGNKIQRVIFDVFQEKDFKIYSKILN